MDHKQLIPNRILVVVALVQGFCLLFLHQSIEHQFWPYGSSHWLLALYSVVLIIPTMLLLGLHKEKELEFVKWLIPAAVIVGLCGYYVGSQDDFTGRFYRSEYLLFPFMLTMSIATFKILMYAQQFAEQGRLAFSYSELFRWSWRNFLTLGLALLFALMVWGILMLWASLFRAIGIHFFYDVFIEGWFYYPVIALAYGFGIIIFRRLTHIIDTISRIQQALMKFLLVLITFVSIIFLITLPFTGLSPLWESGGSALILWMQALIFFFVNAVYQDDPESRPYNQWLHKFIFIGIALLPAYSAISFYGLSLRIDQYGWSVDRLWAFLIWFLLALFSIGYLWGIIRLREGWQKQLSKVNVSVGLVVLVSMLLVNSPILDFRKITVISQLNLLREGKISEEEFSIYYFSRNLSRPGREALEKLKNNKELANPQLAARITNLLNSADRNKILSKEEFISAIHVSEGRAPGSLIDVIYSDLSGLKKWFLRGDETYYLMPLELNDDEVFEYLFVIKESHGSHVELYVVDEESWSKLDFHRDNAWVYDDKKFLEAVKSGEYSLAKPKWPKIIVGNEELQAR